MSGTPNPVDPLPDITGFVFTPDRILHVLVALSVAVGVMVTSLLTLTDVKCFIPNDIDRATSFSSSDAAYVLSYCREQNVACDSMPYWLLLISVLLYFPSATYYAMRGSYITAQLASLKKCLETDKKRHIDVARRAREASEKNGARTYHGATSEPISIVPDTTHIRQFYLALNNCGLKATMWVQAPAAAAQTLAPERISVGPKRLDCVQLWAKAVYTAGDCRSVVVFMFVFIVVVVVTDASSVFITSTSSVIIIFRRIVTVSFFSVSAIWPFRFCPSGSPTGFACDIDSRSG